MNPAQSRATTSRNILFLFLIASLCISTTGCEDLGFTGQGVTDSGTSVEIDTFQVDAVEGESYTYYSGNLPYFSAGYFSDQFFGDMEAIGLLRPALPYGSDIGMNENAEMELRLVINKAGTYGDSTDAAEFDLIELDQTWRGNDWQIDNAVQTSDDEPVGSFNITDHDTVDIPLDSAWVHTYRQNFLEYEEADRNSVYKLSFPGLAVMPTNAEKIVPVNVQASKFMVINPESDTVNINVGDTGYSLNRSNESSTPTGTFKLNSTLEDVVKFDLDLTRENLGTLNIANAELVFYTAESVLNSTINQNSTTEQRGGINFARLHLADPQNVPSALQSGSVISTGIYDSEDGSFRFNITSFAKSAAINGIRPEFEFYVTVESNNGIVRSSLIYNNQAPEDKSPQLIVTSVKNTQGSD